MKNNLKEFYGINRLSKTLRWELKPIGTTEQHIRENLIIERDIERSGEYKEVKKILDSYYQFFIDKSLKDAELDWYNLENSLRCYEKNDEKSAKLLESHQKNSRKEIIKLFKSQKEFSSLFKEDILSKVLPGWVEDDQQEAIRAFNKFSTYFTGFLKNRENVFTENPISTAVTYRLVHQNFPKFLGNIDIYENLKEIAPSVITDVEKELKDCLQGLLLEDIFCVDFYNKVLTQKGIDFYNVVLSGIAKGEGNQKIRGINEFSNLFKQKNPEIIKNKKAVQMTPLFKQILSDRETLSFLPEQFDGDSSLYQSVMDFNTTISGQIEEEKSLLEKISLFFKDFDTFDDESIFISNKELTNVSLAIFGQWGLLQYLLSNYYLNCRKLKKEDVDKALKKKAFSVAELNAAISFGQETLEEKNLLISNYVSFAETYIDKIIDTQNALYQLNSDELKIKENEFQQEIIKEYLDAVQGLYHFMKVFQTEEEFKGTSSFYSQFNLYIEPLLSMLPLYNKVRNYATQKPYSTEKFKLNFNISTLADGWDKNKEQANAAVILARENNYFLGIINKNCKVDFNKVAQCTDEKEYYKKMEYKLLPGPNKMLPKVFLSEKGKKLYSPSSKLLEKYNKGMHKKGDTFDLEFCHELIDFFKTSIIKNEDWRVFDFQFSPTNEYADISNFYQEVEDQGYSMTFKNIDAKVIDELVENDQLYLFQIYNKDFAKGATGRENLHTMYWKALFAKENLDDVVYKLNGGAELFYRPKSIDNIEGHKQGSKKVNRRDNHGNPIPDSIHRELYLYANNNLDCELSPEAKLFIDRDMVRISDVTHDLVKDKRYTEDKYQFHVPITINFKAHGNDNINKDVNEYLATHDDVYTIGIDRGERHLLYVSLINPKGEIVLQKSYNIVNQMNYHAKLAQKEKERDGARKNWHKIENIKELKTGYLSQVIHEIVTLMVEYNAIIVMEDLNYGFKRGRFHIEKQVYQKFEKMLIEKLNFYVRKDLPWSEQNGLLKGLQLTSKFESFEKLGKQSGFVFYVPAAYTSKIDPTTGFVNLFDMNLTNAEQRKDFICKFNNIIYSKSEEAFLCNFNYNNFKTFQEDYAKEWTISTRKDRIVREKNNGHWVAKTVSPTESISKALSQLNISYEDGNDILPLLKDVEKDTRNAAHINNIFYAIKNTLQMRNSNSQTGEDYIISPVKNQDGQYFDSRELGDNETLPKDADANGAYHIALKGLWVLGKIRQDGKLDRLGHNEWFSFAQKKGYR